MIVQGPHFLWLLANFYYCFSKAQQTAQQLITLTAYCDITQMNKPTLIKDAALYKCVKVCHETDRRQV